MNYDRPGDRIKKLIKKNGLSQKEFVEKFNESVRKYKRFADINAAGDEELASEKLRDAGTDLYQSCEWALKNYLYKVAITRFENGEISNEKKGNEIDFLSMKDTNLFKLIDAFKLTMIKDLRILMLLLHYRRALMDM